MNQQPRDKLNEQFIHDFFSRWEAAWSSGDPERVALLLTDDVVFEESDISETLHGRDAAREFLTTLYRAFPDIKLEVEELYLSLDGTRVADRVRWQGTMLGPLDPPGFAPTGTQVEMEAAGFFEFRDGLIKSYTGIFDMLHISQQIGAVPQSGTPGERMGVLMQRIAAWRMRKR